jgi:hypothetical protein
MRRTKMMRDVPVLGSLGVYFLLDQQLTNVPVDVRGKKDYWNPALLYGVLVQVAP